MRYKIVEKIQRPSKDLIASIGAPRAAYIGSFVRPFGTMDSAIQSLAPGWRLMGPAVTVDLDEPDPGLPMLAMDLMEEGDVLVIAARGDCSSLCFGGGMASSGSDAKLGGAVIDGAVSDREHIISKGFPVFSRGATPVHETRYLPGSINIPIVCGGVVVSPGDLVVGSGDGVAVIRQDLIPWVAKELEAQRGRLANYSTDLRAGLTIGQSVKARERYKAHPLISWE